MKKILLALTVIGCFGAMTLTTHEALAKPKKCIGFPLPKGH